MGDVMPDTQLAILAELESSHRMLTQLLKQQLSEYPTVEDCSEDMALMSHEDPYMAAQCRWAAKKLEVPVEDVVSVRFEYEKGYSYSEYTYDNGSFDAYVMTKGGERFLYDLDPTEVIAECMKELL